MFDKYRKLIKAKLVASFAAVLMVAAVFSSLHQLEHIDEHEHEPSHSCEICLFSVAIDNALENNKSNVLYIPAIDNYGLYSYTHNNDDNLKYAHARAPPELI